MPALLTDALRRQRNALVAPYMRGDVLDIGCGYGTAIQFIEPGARYVGVELHEELVAWLRDQFPQHRFVRLDVDREPLALDEPPFDTALLIAVIEHVFHPERLLAQVREYLKPGGRVVITTPTRLGDVVHRWGSRLGFFSRDAAEDHKAIFDRRSLRCLLEACGLEIQVSRVFEMGGNQLVVAGVPQRTE